mgnify:CR=1 FL=1
MLGGDVLRCIEGDVTTLDRDEDAVGEQTVVVACGGALLGIGVAQQRTIARVDQQHLARSETPAFDD